MIMWCSSVPIVSSYGISFSSLWIVLALVCQAPLSLHGFALSSAQVLLWKAFSLPIRRPCLHRSDDGDGVVTFQGSASCFVKDIWRDLEWTLEALKDIIQGFTTNLEISEVKAFEIVGVEELSKLKADRFLLVGPLLTAKHFHKEPLFGTTKNIWCTWEDITTVHLDALERFLFSFKSDLDRRRVLRSSPWTFDEAL
ncbi:hypothetical protein L3X38_001503 [Prunus dulcis]|uniref:DUF4283 domain-containing protein n=1 Tax=Prunus dulcis TaxID=3755 RepID=A0AAD4WUI4_PRUDU|nr:hypothetical protein L3X38_001503 [Prunus dulcis]